MSDTTIAWIDAREILDSRGNPTIEVDVVTDDGSLGRAAVPSGASTGINEAVELRDGDKARFGGKGVLTAVANVTDRIGPSLLGFDAADQSGIDDILIELDGTPNKAELGANAILGVSLACAHASAASHEVPLYRWIGGVGARAAGPDVQHPQRRQARPGLHGLPGVHGHARRASSFREALRAGAEIFASAARDPARRGSRDRPGRRGWLRAVLTSNEAAVEVILRAIEKAGYKPGDEIGDRARPRAPSSSSRRAPASTASPAATASRARAERSTRRDDRPVGRLGRPLPDRLARGRPRRGGLGRLDRLNARLGDKVQLVGDDLLVTNPAFIRTGINEKAANSVLIKLNQIGTLTETIDAIDTARRAGWSAVVSPPLRRDRGHHDLRPRRRDGHRADQDRRPVRSERVAKYNRLLRIADELGDDARYLGRAALSGAAGRGEF